MKRTFNISIKKTYNYDSVSVSVGFEEEMDLFEYDKAKQEAIEEAHRLIVTELNKLKESKKQN